MWLIAPAMELSDKPLCVEYGLSSPLDQIKEGKVTPFDMPFTRWRALINDRRRSEGKQVYLCPLNTGTNHFTLLEIIEQSEVICHYDSMASKNTIRGKRRSRVRQLV